MTAELGVRERKKLAARKALTDAALTLFERNGFDATTVNDIANLAGMSPRTFFRYFNAKEDVVFHKSGQHLEALRAILRERPASETNSAALRPALATFAEILEEEQDEIQRRARLANSSRALTERNAIELQSWCLALAEELLRRPGRPDVTRCHLLGAAGVQVLSIAIMLRTDSEQTLPQLTDHCYNELVHVICIT
jgi:AcrR family transcriptional regulator